MHTPPLDTRSSLPKEAKRRGRLWPVLREKIDRAEADPDHPMPEIALRLVDAYSLSRRVNPAAYWIASAANTDDD